MRFGIWSNGLRDRAIAADIYDLDLEEIVAADRLGYEEAWVSEHIGGPANAVPNAELLIAKAAGLTSRICMGTAVRLLPLYNPIDVATGAAMLDHLLRGRYLFGFGSGITFFKNMEQRGLTNDMRHAMVRESLDFVLKCWTSPEPFDWNGKHWHGTSIKHAAAAVPKTVYADRRRDESGFDAAAGGRARLDVDVRPVLGARSDR